jgi:16S rRNA processing protein RimM
VRAVEANPAHDLLVLDTGALVPIVFVVSQADGVVVIDPPEGLLEL